MLTLEMTCDVTENGWIPIDVQSLDTLILFVLANLILKESCKVGGSYQMLSEMCVCLVMQRSRTIGCNGCAGEPENLGTNLDREDIF
jgi:hypothetical protein